MVLPNGRRPVMVRWLSSGDYGQSKCDHVSWTDHV